MSNDRVIFSLSDYITQSEKKGSKSKEYEDIAQKLIRVQHLHKFELKPLVECITFTVSNFSRSKCYSRHNIEQTLRAIPVSVTGLQEVLDELVNENVLIRESSLLTHDDDMYQMSRPAIQEYIINHGLHLDEERKEIAVQEVSENLGNLISEIPDGPTKRFAEETKKCYEVGAYRAAIVMSWNLAIYHLKEWVIKHKLT